MISILTKNKILLAPFFLFLVFGVLPVIDNVTGALFKLKIISEGAIGSPSQLARFALFILVIYFIDYAKYIKPLKLILAVSCYLLAIEVFFAFYHMNFKAFLFGLVFSIKLLFTMSCYLYISQWINNNKERTIYVIQQLINYGTIVAILVLLAYFSGFHISNYKIGIATRGLFISGNGLGIVLGVSTILLIYFTKNFTFYNLIKIMLLLITTALLGTKASLIFILTSLFLLLIKLLRYAPIVSTIVLSGLALYLVVPLIELIGSIFENIIYKFTHIDDKLHFIASSRDKFILEAFNQIKLTDLYAFRVIFGGGAYYSYLDFSLGGELFRKSLENDLFELFFAYGLLLVVPYLLSFCYAFKKSFQNGNLIISFTLLMVFLHSMTMGHVLFNGTSAITYAVCLALAIKGAKVTKHDF